MLPLPASFVSFMSEYELLSIFFVHLMLAVSAEVSYYMYILASFVVFCLFHCWFKSLFVS